MPELSLRTSMGLAVLSGVLLGICHPVVIEPLGATPVDASGLSGLIGFVALVPLLLAIRDASVKRAYWLSWLALVVQFALVLRWLHVAMTVFGGLPWLGSVAALLLLCATLSTGIAGGFAVARHISKNWPIPMWLSVPIAFLGAEFTRNFGLVGGFPWANLGYSQATVPVMLQSASLVGVYGLCFFLALVNATLVEVIRARVRGLPLPRRPVFISGGLIAFSLLYGVVRLQHDDSGQPTVKVAMLQGNIDQRIKNKEKLHKREIIGRYHRLQTEAIEAGAQVVVWPEAAVFGLRADAKSLAKTHVIPKGGPMPEAGMIGAGAYESYRDEESGKRKRRHYNTVFAVDEGLTVRGRYDKVHLVPFGEYVPWPLYRFVRHFVPGVTTRGEIKPPVRMRVGELEFQAAATVCYEGLFPEITRRFTREGAQVMFNVTNDAWYGISSMASQHMHLYAMRAAESARAVARAANTGISGWVDTRGRVRAQSALYETTYVLGDVPLSDETTLYTVIGPVVPTVCIFGGALLWWLPLLGPGFWRRRRARIEWGVGAAGIGVAAFTLFSHHFLEGPVVNEAVTSRNTVLFIGALLVGVGAWSGRPWGRRAQIITGAIGSVSCAVGALYAPLAAVWAVAALAVAVLAFRRPEAYTREPEVFLRPAQDDGPAAVEGADR